jgi:centrin-1
MEYKMGEKETEDEIARAFELFSDPHEEKITFESLKKVIAEIEENISNEELMAMIKEANKENQTEEVTLD